MLGRDRKNFRNLCLQFESACRDGYAYSRSFIGLVPIRFLQKLVHDLLGVTEIRPLQAVERLREIQQTLSGRTLQDAERAGNFKPIVDRDLSSFSFVYQHKVRVHGERERDGRALSQSQRTQSRVGDFWGGLNFRP